MSGSRIIREVRRALLLCVCAASGFHPLLGLDPNRAVDQYVVSRWQGTTFPGGVVHAIAQTTDGYLWIGAENGLVRFDGVNFRLFNHANTPSLPAGHILGLVVDSAGFLWVRMESPYLLRYRGEVFEQAYRLDFDEAGVTTMARDRAGRVLVAATDALLRYGSGKVTDAENIGGVGGLALAIAETAGGSLWIGMRDTGLLRIRGGSRTHITAVPDRKVNALLPDAGEQLWIGTDSGLARWNGSAVTQDKIPEALLRRPILSLARDRDSNVWVATPSGISRIDPNGAASALVQHHGAGRVQAIFEDREGNLWLGGTDGLVQFRDPPFLSYGGLNGGAVHFDDQRRAWFAPGDGGLLLIKGTTRRAITLAGLDKDVVYSMCGGSGELWVGRRVGGLTRLREVDGQFEAKTYTAEDGLPRGGIYALHRARSNALWAGSVTGSMIRIHEGRITTFTRSDGLSGEAITTIIETPDGVIWAGTSGGLQAFRGGAWKVYGGQDGLPPGRVNSLTTDEQGMLWIGGAGGLFHWSGSRAEPLRQAPEVLRAEILGIAADRRGNLWVASEGHVFRVARASLLGTSKGPAAVREFGIADGLPSTQAVRRDHAVGIDSSGRVWFALHGGFSVLDPTRASDLPPASVTMEAVTVDGQPLTKEGPARFPADRRRIAFSFNGVSLSFPDRVRYRYRLDEYDTEWSQPTQSREAAYTNLPPGRYKFRLMATNGEGLWNGAEVSVAFEATPRFWQAWWFRLTGVFLAIAGIVAAYQYRLSRIRAAMNLRFEERLGERTRIAQELHDTLLQGFLSAAMQLQVAADIMPEDSAARPRVARALQLMQQVIEEGRNAVQGLRAGGLRSVPLETALAQTWQDLSGGNAADFRIVVEGRRRELHPVVQDEMFRIGREALTNACRHAGARHVEVELTYLPDSFRLFVRDDGQGIDPTVLQNGRDGHWGLIGMRERAEKLGGQIHVFTRASAGTEIVLEVPAKVAFHEQARK